MRCSNCNGDKNVIHWIPLKGSGGVVYLAWIRVCDYCYNDYLTDKKAEILNRK